jgi:hypothetical protein
MSRQDFDSFEAYNVFTVSRVALTVSEGPYLEAVVFGDNASERKHGSNGGNPNELSVLEIVHKFVECARAHVQNLSIQL